jgi:hypothetical protein
MGMPAIAEDPAIKIPTRYTWSFPGAPVKVQLSLGVVERLQAELSKLPTDAPKEGYLLGSAAGRTTDILEFRSIADPERSSPADGAIPLALPEALQTVGYYKVTRETALRLTESDIDLAESVVPWPHQVFLLIQLAEPGPANATFFFWDGGRIRGDFAFLEFPFDAAWLAKAEQDRIQTACNKKVVPQPELLQPAIPVEDSHPRPRRGLPRALWSGIAGLVIGLSLIAFLAVSVFPRRSLLKQALPETSPAAGVDTRPKTLPLGLQAQRQGADLKVTWNGSSDAIRTASSGVLMILAGGEYRQIGLDVEQMRHGSIVYAPTADQIRIELTVHGSQGALSESVIVLLPQMQPGASKRALSVRSSPPTNPVPPAVDSHALAAVSDVISTLPPVPVNGNVLDAPPPVIQPVRPSVLPPGPTMNSDAKANSGKAPNTGTVQSPTAPQSTNTASVQPSPVELPFFPPEIDKASPLTFPADLTALIIKPKIVEIKVAIDVTGRVVKAEAMASKEWVPQLMTVTAVRAARLYRFKPARRGAQPIPSEMILQFRFNPPR